MIESNSNLIDPTLEFRTKNFAVRTSIAHGERHRAHEVRQPWIGVNHSLQVNAWLIIVPNYCLTLTK